MQAAPLSAGVAVGGSRDGFAPADRHFPPCLSRCCRAEKAWYYRLECVHQDVMSNSLEPENMTSFRHRVFVDVIKLRSR